jgi:uncharacterized protein YraI
MLTANDTANVRSGPGTNYPRIGQLTQGQQVEITGKNAAGDWWQFSQDGADAWVAASMVTANEAAASVQVAANIPEPPAAPTAAPQPVRPAATARPVAQPPQAPAAKAFAANGLDFRPPSTNPRITVWCRVWNNTRSGLMGGTLRVLRGGAQVGGDVSFGSDQAHGDPGMASQFKYNSGCKLELPLAEGAYTAVLVQGGQVVSDGQAFNVAGNTREFIAVFQQR